MKLRAIQTWLTRRFWARNAGAVPLKSTRGCPSKDTEYNPWFLALAPYTEIALPSKVIVADAPRILVRL